MPEKPRDVETMSQSTSHVDIRWMQTGIVSSYVIVVANEEDGNYTVKWNQTFIGYYIATVNNLSVSGKRYYINIMAVSGNQSSDMVKTSAVTCEHDRLIKANNLLLKSFCLIKHQ